MIETKIICPLGSDCERTTPDGKIERCRWYLKVIGKDPQSEKEYDQFDCAINWAIILLLENTQVNRSQVETTSSFRNEMVKQNQQVISPEKILSLLLKANPTPVIENKG